MNPDSPTSNPAPALAQVMERNIEALIARRRAEDDQRGFPEMVAHAVSRFAGSMQFVFLHLLLFGSWIIINLPAVPGPKFDPSYVMLASFASVEAIFLSTFVLITQSRMAAAADKRADLDLQISLLAEHEITKVLQLVSELMERQHPERGPDEELAELKRDVAPEKVMDKLEATSTHNPSK